MWQLLKTWNHERKSKKFQHELKLMKAEANRRCLSACADPICQQIGCLNQDGFALRHRINLLLKRIDKGDEIPVKVIEPTPPDNLVQFKDYLK